MYRRYNVATIYKLAASTPMKLRKIYFYFWSIAFIHLLISFVFNLKAMYSINIHSTYFVADYSVVSRQISVCLTILGFLHWIIEKVNRNFSKRFSTFHFYFTIGSCLIYWGTYFVLSFDDPEEVFSEFGTLETMTLLILFLNAIVQSIFVFSFFNQTFILKNKASC